MTKHYNEADLLETYYTQPGESMPVMMHLASCSDCAARYDRLERKLREAAACDVERPATFWSRQRLSIAKKISAMGAQPRPAVLRSRAIAAAFLAFLLGAAVVYKVHQPQPVAPQQQPAAVVADVPSYEDEEDFATPSETWESEELADFQPVVQWEGWVEGGSSL
jgi:hypothetical protein